MRSAQASTQRPEHHFALACPALRAAAAITNQSLRATPYPAPTPLLPYVGLHPCLAAPPHPASQPHPPALTDLPLPSTQVYFPAALLDQLVAQLGAGGAALAAERQQVADLLQRVRGAALGQTPVIQQLFAH